MRKFTITYTVGGLRNQVVIEAASETEALIIFKASTPSAILESIKPQNNIILE